MLVYMIFLCRRGRGNYTKVDDRPTGQISRAEGTNIRVVLSGSGESHSESHVVQGLDSSRRSPWTHYSI